MQDYEKLGVFYLGRTFDIDLGRRTDAAYLYDAKDLVTHAVCVGMTGSGKTGLCLALLEEAAIDGIPAIVIDPKGDLGNLLLTFPGLTAEEFAPWVNADDARRKGLTPQAFAEHQANLWKRGLADWNQDGERIQRLRDAAEFRIYTPGSNAGIPVSILESLNAPPAAIIESADLFRERIATTVTSLLSLLGLEADPIRSREHILLSTIFDRAWREGRNLDLGSLIQSVQNPGTQRVGVMDLETFYPEKERFGLAMQLNGLLASPGFAAWMEGEPLDVKSFLYAPDGRPRISIFNIAHLGDGERMFFVSLLLNQILGWTRTQTGTTSLRALVYMDEIAGYCPPVKNPPSKAPLLTLMKQARAFGVGVVLATQNPVDLDYKGLSNAGTWFIGRLQTEQDKARLLDGLESAAGTSSSGFDRAAIDQALSRLQSRVFVVQNAHDDGPSVIETRWVMSYLRGPLTREQIATLKSGAAKVNAPGLASTAPVPVVERAAPTLAPKPAAAPAMNPKSRPVIPPDVPEAFLPFRTPGNAPVTYRPALLATATILIKDTAAGIDTTTSAAHTVPFGTGLVTLDWDAATPSAHDERSVVTTPIPGASFDAPPTEALKAKSYDAWKRDYADYLSRAFEVTVYRAPALKLTSEVGESEADFRRRLGLVVREQRDLMAQKLRTKYAPKLATLEDRVRRAEQALEKQKEQARGSKLSTAISFGSTILGAFMGRKKINAGTVGRAGSTIRGMGRTMQESGDVERASETVETVREQLARLESEFQTELNSLTLGGDAKSESVEPVTVRPKKAGIKVRVVALAWDPGQSA